jgi:Rieske Fe-S protein
MNRKGFIKTCGLTCLCGSSLVQLLQSCSASRIISGKIVADELIVELKNFDPENGNDKDFRKYVIVQHGLLQFPICVFRLSEYEYSALWMQCTHQGNEVQVYGDRLECPAHGSVFDNKGAVQQGPAEKALRTFPVIIEKKQIRISLKAI